MGATQFWVPLNFCAVCCALMKQYLQELVCTICTTFIVWAVENPHATHHSTFQLRFIVNVWTRISDDVCIQTIYMCMIVCGFNMMVPFHRVRQARVSGWPEGRAGLTDPLDCPILWPEEPSGLPDHLACRTIWPDGTSALPYNLACRTLWPAGPSGLQDPLVCRILRPA
jgi:hypothetical protein